MTLTMTLRNRLSKTSNTTRAVAALFGFLALGELNRSVLESGPIRTAVAIGAVATLLFALSYSFRAMKEDVEERQRLEDRVDELEEATDDDDVEEAIGT